jgi:hypothetical protein
MLSATLSESSPFLNHGVSLHGPYAGLYPELWEQPLILASLQRINYHAGGGSMVDETQPDYMEAAAMPPPSPSTSDVKAHEMAFILTSLSQHDEVLKPDGRPKVKVCINSSSGTCNPSCIFLTCIILRAYIIFRTSLVLVGWRLKLL